MDLIENDTNISPMELLEEAAILWRLADVKLLHSMGHPSDSFMRPYYMGKLAGLKIAASHIERLWCQTNHDHFSTIMNLIGGE